MGIKGSGKSSRKTYLSQGQAGIDVFIFEEKTDVKRSDKDSQREEALTTSENCDFTQTLHIK